MLLAIVANGRPSDILSGDILEVFPLQQKSVTRIIQELNLESLSLT
jgi:hypothetical protein